MLQLVFLAYQWCASNKNLGNSVVAFGFGGSADYTHALDYRYLSGMKLQNKLTRRVQTVTMPHSTRDETMYNVTVVGAFPPERRYMAVRRCYIDLNFNVKNTTPIRRLKFRGATGTVRTSCNL